MLDFIYITSSFFTFYKLTLTSYVLNTWHPKHKGLTIGSQSFQSDTFDHNHLDMWFNNNSDDFMNFDFDENFLCGYRYYCGAPPAQKTLKIMECDIGDVEKR